MGYSWQRKRKKNRRKKCLGSKLDKEVQTLQCGQTNGIPQGSVLFDFIAEIVLGYSDMIVSERLKEKNIERYSIIRYRDDYRIFSNDKDEAEAIIKVLSDVLADLNLHFNNKKTGITDEIIKNAIKPDKIYWNSKIPIIMPNIGEGNVKKIKYQLTLQKHLLEILWLSKKYPNSGSINKALTAFARRLDGQEKIREQILPLVSIIVDIISNNPKTIPAGIGLLSKLMVKNEDSSIILSNIKKQITSKLRNMPNYSYLDIWLQRLLIHIQDNYNYSDKLCDVVVHPEIPLWDSSFVTKKGVGSKLPPIIDSERIKEMESEIQTNVFDIFDDYV